MIYGLTTTTCTPNHLIPIELGKEKKKKRFSAPKLGGSNIHPVVLFKLYFYLTFFLNSMIGGCGSSVGMIMVQFEHSLRQRSEVPISIRSSYSKKIFYEQT